MAGQGTLNPASFPPDDAEWMGSHLFQSDPALYKDLYAERMVEGWAFDPNRDKDMDGNEVTPQWGRPDCASWWNDGSIGLQAKVMAAAASTSRVANLLQLAPLGLLPDEAKDYTTRLVIDKTPLNVSRSDNLTDFSRSESLTAQFQDVLGTAGLAWENMKTSTMIHVLVPALPMIQAIVLLGICVCLAPFMLAGRLSLDSMFAGALAIFTVKFWSCLWAIAAFLDDKLWASMFPDSSSIGEALKWLTGSNVAITHLMINLLTLSLYVLLPIIWSYMMAVAGMAAIANISRVKANAVDSFMSAGVAGVAIGKAASNSVLRRATRR